MAFPLDRRTRLALIGSVVALIAGLSAAWALMARHQDETPPPPPASSAGLVIEQSKTARVKVDPSRPLRCFAQGREIGEMTLADCARRNGVATDVLDVGLDPSDNVAASDPAKSPEPPGEGAPTGSQPATGAPLAA